MTLIEEVLKLKGDLQGGRILMAKYLSEIRNKSAWEGDYPSWSYFLNDVDLDEGTASKLITIYDFFVTEKKIPIEKLISVRSWSKIYELLEVCQTGDCETWLSKAAELSKTDLLREIEETKTGIPQRECEHAFEVFMRCKTCKVVNKVYDETTAPSQTRENAPKRV